MYDDDEYYANGKVKKTTSSRGSGCVEVYEYYENGKQQRFSIYTCGELFYLKEYDENGRCIKEWEQ
jgi:antitoxin component YwqK of YwqJK toxin-antitoxin module